ncbi:MAG: bifunctional lysylphosphatidylglycerol flippase/synthetase MprF [Steroidobacteraceae bacterium]
MAIRPELKQLLLVVAAGALFLLGVAAIAHLLEGLSWSELRSAILATGGRAVLLGIAATAASYVCLTLYDALALHYLGLQLPARTIALGGFTGYAVANTLGFAMFSGGAVRLRTYGAAGLQPGQVAAVAAFDQLVFLSGLALLMGLALIGERTTAAAALHLPSWAVVALGAALLLLLGLYLAGSLWRREPLHLHGVTLRYPPPRIALLQPLLGGIDLALAAAVLYALLPPEVTPAYPAFLGLYLVAMAVGVFSGVPGGAGIFEATLLLLLPGDAGHEALAAMLVYRAIYYLLPFVMALLLLGGHELRQRQPLLFTVLQWLRAWWSAAAPPVLAAAVFLSGLALLLSGATPAEASRMAILSSLLPLTVLELSHLLGSVLGLGLMLLARGLLHRLDSAWQLTVVFLAAGAVASLAKGFDFEEALLLSVILLALLAARDRFRARSALLAERLSGGTIAALVAAVVCTATLGYFAYGHQEYSREMWWQFAADADAPRSLRAGVVVVVLVGLLALWSMLRRANPEPPLPDAAELAELKQLIAAGDETNANLALLGDKQILFSRRRDGFLMFRAMGRSWVAMGDPVGPPAAQSELVWSFREACDHQAVRPVFYQIGVATLPLYIDCGLSLYKLGEEALVNLADFGLEGPRRAELRQARRRAVERTGLAFAVTPAAEVPAIMDELRAVSDEWLDGRPVAEKGFSLGRFDAAYLANFDMAVVRQGGRIVAFANLWKSGSRRELSIDLMRHTSTVAGIAMDYLMVETMLWGRAQGFGYFNLGMAPLSGLHDRRHAPLWNRAGSFLYRHGEHFYNFEGLRRYKQKFLPEWRPRYLAAPGGLSLPQVLADVTSLIAGGSLRVLRR